MNISIFIVLLIAVAIGLGFYFKINIGLFGMFFAYLVGAFVLDMKVKSIINLWPINLFFTIMTITFFYRFAVSNGTLEKVATKTVYATRKATFLIPVVCYFLAFIMTAVGPGPYAVYVFLAPIIMAISDEIKMNKILAAIIVVSGVVAGCFSNYGVGGAITRGYIEAAGYAALAEQYTSRVFWNTFLAETILFIAAYIFFKGYKVASTEIKKPEPFTSKQKITLILMFGAIGFVIIPSTLASFIPHSTILALLKAKLDISFVSIFAALLAIFFKVGSEKEALKQVPWNTIILISGISMLISVAVEAGSIDLLAHWFSTRTSTASAPIILSLVAGTMSFFASTLGVVMPTLYPIVEGVANATGLAPTTLFSIITISGSFVGISPFSSGGALTLTGVTDEETRDKLFKQLLIIPFVSLALAIVLLLCGVIR